MTELKMHQTRQTPRGIHQKTIIQHTLRFSDVDDCFQKFRLVCKTWKDAVETIRFNRTLDEGFFYDLDDKMTLEGMTLAKTNYFSKYLRLFKKIHIPLSLENQNEIFPLVLNNMKKLNEIMFFSENASLLKDFDSFAFQMLQNSHETLLVLSIPKFVIPDIDYPKLRKLDLWVGEDYILLQEFQTCFPQSLKNMENLEVITLCLYSCWESVGEYICENYSKHCISSSENETVSVMPVKIFERIDHLWPDFANKKYVSHDSHLQYAHAHIYNAKNPMDNGWDRYQEFFDKWINLKAIELQGTNGDFFTEILPMLSQGNQEIWKERISYFQKRGIRLAHKNEICDNENLQKKLAKEARVRWGFNFY